MHSSCAMQNPSGRLSAHDSTAPRLAALRTHENPGVYRNLKSETRIKNQDQNMKCPQSLDRSWPKQTLVRFMQFRITFLLIIYSIPCRVCHKKLLAGRMLDHISGTCLGAWKWSTYIVGTCLSHFWHMFGWKRSQELMLYPCMYVSDSDVCFVSNIFTPCMHADNMHIYR